ncbi:hypothetical protein, partial [Brevibacillus sp. LEMMJ03]|uniref:hypothetical protein n=1 Tax=Brevibacillus sp. LEMMJ03 TaxID=2595056 RepID=UPI001C8F5104
MTYIRHVTLNTGHVRKSFPSEIDKRLYFILRRMRKDIFSSSGTEIIDGYTAKGTEVTGNGAVITVFKKNVPIITVGMTKHKHSDVWKLMHESSTLPLQTNPNNPPDVPYAADRLEIGA